MVGKRFLQGMQPQKDSKAVPVVGCWSLVVKRRKFALPVDFYEAPWYSKFNFHTERAIFVPTMAPTIVKCLVSETIFARITTYAVVAPRARSATAADLK